MIQGRCFSRRGRHLRAVVQWCQLPTVHRPASHGAIVRRGRDCVQARGQRRDAALQRLHHRQDGRLHLTRTRRRIRRVSLRSRHRAGGNQVCCGRIYLLFLKSTKSVVVFKEIQDYKNNNNNKYICIVT